MIMMIVVGHFHPGILLYETNQFCNSYFFVLYVIIGLFVCLDLLRNLDARDDDGWLLCW